MGEIINSSIEPSQFYPPGWSSTASQVFVAKPGLGCCCWLFSILNTKHNTPTMHQPPKAGLEIFMDVHGNECISNGDSMRLLDINGYCSSGIRCC